MTQRQTQYFANHQDKIDALQAMWGDSHVQLYNDTKLPSHEELQKSDSVFLAGPTSRNQILEYNWRCDAVALLRACGFYGWIFCPEPRGQEAAGDFTERSYIHEWESSRLMNAAHVAFWIPRKAEELLGLNTNLELGIFLGMLIVRNESRKTPFDKPEGHFARQSVHIGWPPQAERMGLPGHYVSKAEMKIYPELLDLCKAIAKSSREKNKSS
jgi:hypothetical protein